jgi:hypothetical protein
MAINFPTSPSTNDTFTAGSITYKWDGAKWIGLGVTPTDRLVEGSNKLEIDGSNNLVWTGNNVGIGDSDPRTGLTITKAGTAPTASGNTYPMPAGNWVSTWSTGTANGNDYWAGFGGSGYAVSSATVNIALAPNHNNTSQQAGMYIAGEATSESSSDFTIGKLLSGSAIGSSDSAGNQRATKSELMRITSDGKVGINETNPSRQLSVYDGTNSGVEIKSSITGQSSVFFTDTSDGNIGMIGYTHNNDEMFFRVNDQTRLTIDSGGQLGLNVTDPSDRLHVKGAMMREGYSDGAVVKTIVMTASFGAGTHDIFTCTATGVDNTAVATMEYVSLFAYSGNNHCAGVKLASTRRSASNTAWENLPNVNVAGPNGSDTSIDPNLFFQNGVLMVTIPGSSQVTATVRITTRSFTLVRNYSAG